LARSHYPAVLLLVTKEWPPARKDGHRELAMRRLTAAQMMVLVSAAGHLARGLQAAGR
jgi:hypothetical protein